MYDLPPYRPPSEAHSALFRVARGCPWNKCGFCGMYKAMKFEIRPVDDVKEDIRIAKQFYGDEVRTVFIGDANSLAVKTRDLVKILRFLYETFPYLERVTSYGRAKTLVKKPLEDLKALKEAGLTRLHLGLETGDRFLLRLANKGPTPEEMVVAGRKVVEAGISLSEYVMAGLGGKNWWEQHARNTAAVLNKIDPDFIRLRTTMLTPGLPMYDLVESGEWVHSSPVELLKEERLLIECLEGINSQFVSDHNSNLLYLNGKFPEDKEEMLEVMDAVIAKVAEQEQEAEVRGIPPYRL